MFEKINVDKPFTIIKVHKPVKLMSLRRAVLTPGDYAVQGDLRSKLGTRRDKELIQAGFFELEYVSGDGEEIVRADNFQATEVEPAEVVAPAVDTAPVMNDERPEDAVDVVLPESAQPTQPGVVDESNGIPQIELEEVTEVQDTGEPEVEVVEPEGVTPDDEEPELPNTPLGEAVTPRGPMAVRGHTHVSRAVKILQEETNAIRFRDTTLTLDDGQLLVEDSGVLTLCNLEQAAASSITLAAFVAGLREPAEPEESPVDEIEISPEVELEEPEEQPPAPEAEPTPQMQARRRRRRRSEGS